MKPERVAGGFSSKKRDHRNTALVSLQLRGVPHYPRKSITSAVGYGFDGLPRRWGTPPRLLPRTDTGPPLENTLDTRDANVFSGFSPAQGPSAATQRPEAARGASALRASRR